MTVNDHQDDDRDFYRYASDMADFVDAKAIYDIEDDGYWSYGVNRYAFTEAIKDVIARAVFRSTVDKQFKKECVDYWNGQD